MSAALNLLPSQSRHTFLSVPYGIHKELVIRREIGKSDFLQIGSCMLTDNVSFIALPKELTSCCKQLPFKDPERT
jgi:hypothetical protein